MSVMFIGEARADVVRGRFEGPSQRGSGSAACVGPQVPRKRLVIKFVLVGALQPDLVFQPLPDPALAFVRFVGEFFEAVEALVEDVVDGRVERGEPHVLDDDGAARELERGPAEHFRVVVGRRDLLSEPHRFRRIARVVRVVEEAGADRLGRGGPAEGRAGEWSHLGLVARRVTAAGCRRSFSAQHEAILALLKARGR